MTYGDQLDQVAAALARAQSALRDPTPGNITDHDAAAIARTQIYRALKRQVERVAGSSEVGFVQELHRATINAPQSLPAPPPTVHPVATALRDAADAARLSSDMLATHFSPAGRPLTSDGVAILAGIDRDQGVARLAQLARAASSTDRQLGRWLLRATDTGSEQSVVRGAAVDASDTANAPNPHTRRAAAYATGPSRLHGLTIPPLAEAAQAITSPADTVRALDAARAWLVQHRHQLSSADLRALTRTGAVLSIEIGHLVQATTQANTAEVSRALANRWLRAGAAARSLHSLTPPVPGAGPNALAAAESWLREQLRPDGRWLELGKLLSGTDAAAWTAAATDLTARLPDLSTLVHRGAKSAVERGELLEVQGLEHRAGKLIAVPRWGRANPEAGSAAELLRTTGQLRRHSDRLATAAGVTPEPGLHEADTRYRLNRGALHDELRRIGKSQPIDPPQVGTRQAPTTHVDTAAARRADATQQTVDQQRQDQRQQDELRRFQEQRPPHHRAGPSM